MSEQRSGPSQPRFGLEAKRCLVTGAASGIGAATVLTLVDQGARVAALDVDRVRLIEFTKGLQVPEERLVPLVADVSSEAEVSGAIDQLVTRWGGLDVAVSTLR